MSSATDGSGLHGENTGSGWGVTGRTAEGNAGVFGDHTGGGVGVLGLGGGYGVRGSSAIVGVAGDTANGIGVDAFADGDDGTALRARSGFGRAVDAWSDVVALRGESGEGFALETVGPVKLRGVSGVATLPAGATMVTVHPVDHAVKVNSFVLLTPRANLAGRDLWFTTDPAANTFTIRLSSSRTAPTLISWLVLR